MPQLAGEGVSVTKGVRTLVERHTDTRLRQVPSWYRRGPLKRLNEHQRASMSGDLYISLRKTFTSSIYTQFATNFFAIIIMLSSLLLAFAASTLASPLSSNNPHPQARDTACGGGVEGPFLETNFPDPCMLDRRVLRLSDADVAQPSRMSTEPGSVSRPGTGKISEAQRARISQAGGSASRVESC